MMKKHIIGSFVSLAFVAVLLAPHAQAETMPVANTAALEQIKMLMAKLQELQKQMAAIRGELNEVLKSNITEGTSSDDIKKVQELLATDAQIYPEGQVTGYFGPRTKEAIKKFQERHGLPVTGVVDEETKSLLAEYLKEKQGNTMPVGLLRAPGIAKKMEDRFKLRCDSRGPGKGVGPLCERLKMHDHDDDHDDDHDEDEDEDEDHEHEDDEDEDHHDDTASSTDDSDVTEATLKHANKAIIAAAKAIADATKEIRKADGDTADADEALVEAQTKLTAARKALKARDYVSAVNSANDAEEHADEAKELAKDAEDEDEEEEDEEDEDEEEDDSEDDSEDDD
jgi:hypothetical protein